MVSGKQRRSCLRGHPMDLGSGVKCSLGERESFTAQPHILILLLDLAKIKSSRPISCALRAHSFLPRNRHEPRTQPELFRSAHCQDHLVEFFITKNVHRHLCFKHHTPLPTSLLSSSSPCSLTPTTFNLESTVSPPHSLPILLLEAADL